MSGDLRPRLCALEKGSDGYGFHLHGEKNKLGQFIRLVEPNSPAEVSGLRPGDKLVFVNGENVEGDSHQQVVSHIRAVAGKLELIVVDAETADLLKKHDLKCEKRFVTDGIPIPRDASDSDEEQKNGTDTESNSDPFPIPVQEPEHVPEPVGVSDTNGNIGITSLSLDSKETKLELRPRLCHMKKGATGYGFNLHSEKSKPGQYIRAVDEDSPAEKAGLRPKDKVLQVNGVDVQGMQHSDVVATIKSGGDELRMLVVDAEAEAFFNSCHVTPSEEHLTGPLPEPDSNKGEGVKVKAKAPREPKPLSHSPSNSSASSTASIPAETANSPASEETGHETGLDLNISLQQAIQRAHQKRSNKRAPPMDWSKRSEVFSNL